MAMENKKEEKLKILNNQKIMKKKKNKGKKVKKLESGNIVSGDTVSSDMVSGDIVSGDIEMDVAGRAGQGAVTSGGRDITRDALGYDAVKERERELVSDLFGADLQDSEDEAMDAAPPAATEATQPPEDSLIPPDPFDLRLDQKTVRRPAWEDEDDDTIKVRDVVKTITGKECRNVNGEQQYGSVVRARLDQVMGPTPEWAQLDRKPRPDHDEDDFAKSTGNYLSQETTAHLPKSTLEFKRVTFLNNESLTEGVNINAVEFNPHLQVALVAGEAKMNGTASLFQVDGANNYKIQSIRFPKFPVMCGKFLQDGRRFVVGSNLYGHFFVYDMEAGKETRIPWNHKDQRTSMANFVVSSDGSYLVFLGRHSQLHIFDSKTLLHIETLQAPTQVYSATFNHQGTRMYTNGEGGDVLVWDMNARMCVHRFYDEGCIKGTSIAMSASNQYLACGSSTGIVNIYDAADLSSPSPKPVKALDKLVTSVSSLAFNPTSEILAMASNCKDNALKLVHFPSMTIFKNFPDKKEIDRVRNLNFSPNGGFLAAGNNKGRAILFRLNYFSSY